jgi:hypothetical protein
MFSPPIHIFYQHLLGGEASEVPRLRTVGTDKYEEPNSSSSWLVNKYLAPELESVRPHSTRFRQQLTPGDARGVYISVVTVITPILVVYNQLQRLQQASLPVGVRPHTQPGSVIPRTSYISVSLCS